MGRKDEVKSGDGVFVSGMTAEAEGGEGQGEFEERDEYFDLGNPALVGKLEEKFFTLGAKVEELLGAGSEIEGKS